MTRVATAKARQPEADLLPLDVEDVPQVEAAPQKPQRAVAAPPPPAAAPVKVRETEPAPDPEYRGPRLFLSKAQVKTLKAKANDDDSDRLDRLIAAGHVTVVD